MLAIIDGYEVSFVGYATADDLYQETNLINLGHGEGYGIEQKDLRQWK